MALTFGIRELPWPLPKWINFPKILDIHYQKGEYSKSFLWTRNLTVVDSIFAGGGIAMGRGYRSI